MNKQTKPTGRPSGAAGSGVSGRSAYSRADEPTLPRQKRQGRPAAPVSRPSSYTQPSYGGAHTPGGPSPRKPSQKPKPTKRFLPVLLIVLLVIAAAAAVVLFVLPKGQETPPAQPPAEAAAALAPQDTEIPQRTDEPKNTETAPSTAVPQRTEALQSTAAPAATDASKSASADALQPESEWFSLYDPALRWYWNQLSDPDKELFALLYDGIANIEKEIRLPQIRYTKSQLQRVIKVLRWDCPELVHFQSDGELSYSEQAGTLSSFTPNYVYEGGTAPTVIQQVMAEVEGLLTDEERTSAALGKEHALYRRIVARTVYDKEFAQCANADAVFLYGKAKCSGYASAFSLACRYYGIPCFTVAGNGVTEEGTERHAWNMVQIDGDWYACDPTWDRSVWETYSSYPEPISAILLYFNVTSAEIAKTHLPDKDYAKEGWTLPDCTSEAASLWRMIPAYAAVTAENWQQVLTSRLNEAANGGRNIIILRPEKQKDYDKLLAQYSDHVEAWSKATGFRTSFSTIHSDKGRLLIFCDLAQQDENPYRQNNLYVRFFDVGSADAALVYCEGHYMFIDGGTEKSGSRLLYSFLELNGITDVDAVIVTHPHSDHAGGLCGLFSDEDCRFGALYAAVKASDNKSFNTLLVKARQRGLEPVIPEVGSHFMLGSAKVTFLSPDAEMSYENVNNRSLVVRIDYGETSFLFTGDAMENAELDMLRSGLDLKADVLKAAHHGADTSSSEAFLQAVSPSVVVLTCEADDPSHPGPEALARLQNTGALMLNTGLDGDIVIFSNGTDLTYTCSREHVQP